MISTTLIYTYSTIRLYQYVYGAIIICNESKTWIIVQIFWYNLFSQTTHFLKKNTNSLQFHCWCCLTFTTKAIELCCMNVWVVGWLGILIIVSLKTDFKCRSGFQLTAWIKMVIDTIVIRCNRSKLSTI